MTDEREGPESTQGAGTSGARQRTSEPWIVVARKFWRLWVLAAIGLLLIVWFRWAVLLFAFATLVAYLLEPLVRRMAPGLGDRRGLSVAILYLALLGLGAGFIGGVVPGVVSDLSTLRESAPSAVAKLNEEWLPSVGEWLDETFPGVFGETADEAKQQQVSEVIVHPQPDGSYRVDLRGVHLEAHEHAGGFVIQASAPHKDSVTDIIRDVIASKGDELTEAATHAVRAAVTGVATFVTDLVITFLIAAFLLVDLERVKHVVRSLVPVEHLPDFDNIVRGIDEGMAGAIRGQLLICLINGALAYAGLSIFGVHYALLLAMVASVLSFIPVFGILISAIPLLGVALLSGDAGLEGLAFGKSAALLGWVAGIHLLEANYLNPRVIGTADIHPVILVFALLAGWEVYGPIGAVLALPVASMIQTVFLHVRKRSPRLASPSSARE